ncbi:hypothetical protein TNCV_906961 [Trichonephila clavipes]|nr:hypothetical protein TNCV_906961 [Trichonephila clavipes]
MSSHNRLDDDFGWRTIRLIKSAMSQAEVARNLIVSRIVMPRLWKQLQTAGAVVRWHRQGRSKATTPMEG